jgi:hypothetical protein
MTSIRCCGKELETKLSDEKGDGQRLMAKYGDEFYIVIYRYRAVPGGEDAPYSSIWEYALIEAPTSWCGMRGCTDVTCEFLHHYDRPVMVKSIIANVEPPNYQLHRIIPGIRAQLEEEEERKEEKKRRIEEEEERKEEKKRRIEEVEDRLKRRVRARMEKYDYILEFPYSRTIKGHTFMYDIHPVTKTYSLSVQTCYGNHFVAYGITEPTAIINANNIRCKCRANLCGKFCSFIHTEAKAITVKRSEFEKFIDDFLNKKYIVK